MESITASKIKFIGHTMQHNEFVNNNFEEKILWKKTRWRPRKYFVLQSITKFDEILIFPWNEEDYKG